jgi:hypothetical protein
VDSPDRRSRKLAADWMLRAALIAVRRGYYVFPCRANGKEPAVAHWRDWSTDNIVRLTQYWARHPMDNPAIDTGKSGLIVVDCDMKPDVDGRWNFWKLLMRLNVANPKTLMVNTPSGGMHLYYRAPTTVQLKNSVGRLAEGVDTRGFGGYVIAPGARTAAGSYGVHRDNPIAELPLPLVELLVPPVPERGAVALRSDIDVDGATVLRRELERLARVPVGQRNTELNNSAYRLGRLCGAGVLDAHDVIELLTEAGVGMGLGQVESAKTAASGVSAGERNPRALFALPSGHDAGIA